MNVNVDRTALLDELRKLPADPREGENDFESLLADLCDQPGVRTEVTEESGDRGRDVLVKPRYRPGRAIIQAKCNGATTPVDSGDVQRYSGLYAEPGYVYDALIVTTGRVTEETGRGSGAFEVAKVRDLTLVHAEEEPNQGVDIVKWILKRDPDLKVLDDYIDIDSIIDVDASEWRQVSRPSLMAPALLCCGLVGLLVAAGLIGAELLPGSGTLSIPVVSWATLPFSLGGFLTTAGVVTALTQLRGGPLPLQFVAATLSLGHIGGLSASVLWWTELFRDALRGTAYTIPDYVLLPEAGVGLPLPGALVEAGVGVSAVVVVVLTVLLLWLRHQRTARVSLE